MKCHRKTSFALPTLALFLAGGYLRAQAPEPAPSASSASRPVVSIRIVTQDGRVLSESAQGLAVSVGQPLDASALREAMRQLYRTGDYADLQAVTSDVAGGVRLDFVVRENLFFDQVQFEGLIAPPSDASATAAMQINLGQPYRKDVLDEALGHLQEALREEGFYNSKVTAETIPHPETLQMNVVVHVKPGARARVGEIQLVNDTEFPDRELVARAKLKPGQEITTARVQRAGDRIRKFLVKKGHLSARATVRRGAYDPAKNAVPLDLDIAEGPLVRVVVAGAKFSRGTIKRLLPVYQEGAVDADLLEEGQRNILEQLERDGYYDAEVRYSTEQREVKSKGRGGPGTEEVITYQIKRGAQHRLIGIEISGNHYFSDELLRGRLKIAAAAFGSRGRFSRGLIESDRQSMQNLYIANGFLNARVAVPDPDKYKDKEGILFVRFIVEEGPQTRVASLAIEGNHAFSEKDLLGVIGSTPGQAFSEFNVVSDRDNILALYFNEGFPEARFQAAVEKLPTAEAAAKENANHPRGDGKGPAGVSVGDEVRLTYKIEEGSQVRVKRVLLGGYRFTRPGVLRREVRFRQGEPLREGEVVESQRQLYNLGIFNRVTIEPQNPSGSDPQKNVVALVEEAKRYTLAYGGGLEVQRLASSTNPTGSELRASPRGILEASKLNLTGRADTLSLKLRASTLQGRALLGYEVPDTFGKKALSFQATAYAEKTQDINTFTQDRYEGSVQLTEKLTPLSTLLYRYAFRKVLVSNLKIQQQEIPLFNAPTLVSQFGVTWFRDRRNNPADATRGTFNNVDFSFADTGVGSSASFLRFFAQNASYHPIKRRFSFARSARFGILHPYRDTVSLSFPISNSVQCSGAPPSTVPQIIPLPERFFAGGGTSLRGLALNQAGARDACTGFPVGGQAELILNQELRFPMRLPKFGTQLGGALFYDAGNVYSRLNRISFRPTPPKPVFATNSSTGLLECVQNCSNELNYLAHTIGFGVRYATPVGPIRVDFGYQLNRATFVVPIPCPASTPNCPTNGHQPGHLPWFQIFFSLGAPF